MYARSITGRERSVVLRFPPKLIRACGGGAPDAAIDVIRDELEYRSARHLIERIERRWWQKWSHRPLSFSGADDWAAYGPGDVAVWLVAPTPCPARCEDGWMTNDPDQQCPTCHPPRPHRVFVEPLSAHAQDMAATARSVVRAAQSPRAHGEYVPKAATMTAEQQAERMRRQAERDRVGRVKKERAEISAAEEARDPVRAAAIKRARQERQQR
ncbi:hypothetical protein QMK19_26485 [Streptomyces sp. H10-C2]|uniref:hypothetical protein n=1 Tax=unclassified Streptomyces TaxID=2593676 RepID=UPI0024BB0DA6|nr:MULTISPECIES: hypothetical protein [unclassified Streptomyces]MDJ0373111.1 hypothetical protein [Streptomyces sp. H10-C2]